MTDHRSFANVLSGIRRRHELSQRQVAQASGFTPSFISCLESGKKRARRRSVVRIADAVAHDDMERRQLFLAANFNPDKDEDPVVTHLEEFLVGRADSELKDKVRKAVLLALNVAAGMERNTRET